MTLADVLVRNSGGGATGEIMTDLVKSFPIASVVSADIEDGYEFETLVKVKRGGASFHDSGEGIASTNDTLEVRKVQAYNASSNIIAPLSVLEKLKNQGRYLADQEADKIESILEIISAGFFYGQTAQSVTMEGAGAALSLAKCFPGIINAITSTYEVDATGADNFTSVYAIRAGAMNGVRFIMGGGVGISMPSDYVDQMMPGTVAGTHYWAKVGTVRAYPGLQSLVPHAIGRIKKLSAVGASGKTLTAAMMTALQLKAPAGRPWTHYIMSRVALAQLHTDLVAKLGGLTAWPVPPTNWNGVPIIVDDSISLNETV
jgi:hypothetical protein